MSYAFPTTCPVLILDTALPGEWLPMLDGAVGSSVVPHTLDCPTRLLCALSSTAVGYSATASWILRYEVLVAVLRIARRCARGTGLEFHNVAMVRTLGYGSRGILVGGVEDQRTQAHAGKRGEERKERAEQRG
eukprot:2669305-Rhodomonas_salina.2